MIKSAVLQNGTKIIYEDVVSEDGFHLVKNPIEYSFTDVNNMYSIKVCPYVYTLGLNLEVKIKESNFIVDIEANENLIKLYRDAVEIYYESKSKQRELLMEDGSNVTLN
jgi:hypothetical protein